MRQTSWRKHCPVIKRQNEIKYNKTRLPQTTLLTIILHFSEADLLTSHCQASV